MLIFLSIKAEYILCAAYIGLGGDFGRSADSDCIARLYFR
jgi:hypothetical protein